MNARWQQALSLTLLCAAAAWLVWQWPRSPAMALAGLAVLALWSLAWLGLQFALMWYVNRGDPAPRAGRWQCLRAWWAEAGVATLLFGWRQPFRHAACPDWLPAPPAGGAPGRGVVLVHGFMCNRGIWNPWMRRLRARGHAHVAVTLEPVLGSIDGYVAQIDDAVRRVTAATGRAPVLLCHSMGGLAARAWLRAVPGADARVHRVITLGTPHGGTWAARWSHACNGQQMRLDSDWLRQLAQAEPAQRRALFTCWYSNCDNIVFPASTAALAGADNRFIAGVAHLQMVDAPAVVRACLADIARD